MIDKGLGAELYGQIGSGRPSQSYKETKTYKGRIKQTIEFVAAKSIDIQRKDEVYNYVDIIGSLKHPFIIKFYSWYQTKHHFWLIFEYCPGGTLLELLEQDVRLPEPIIRIFGGDILSALLYMHQQGIIFRDLQPRNIMLDECGNLKLNDFTHAEKLEKPFPFRIPDPELIEYMAPELFDEQGVASFASDLWAFGCLLYRMAAGSTPFFSSSQEDTVSKILKADFQPPDIPDYSDDFNNLLHQLLIRNCFERIRWKTLIDHPFWRNSLQKRYDDTFRRIQPSSLPDDQARLQTNRQFLSTEEKRKTIILPSNSNQSSRLVDVQKGQSIKSLIINSELLKPTDLVFNNTIEQISTPDFKLNEIPITAEQLQSSDRSEVEKAIGITMTLFKNSQVKPKLKYKSISFLIENIRATGKTAMIFANSIYFPQLLVLAKESTSDSLTSGCILLYASIVNKTSEIKPEYLTEEVLAPLFEIYDAAKKKPIKQSSKIIRKIIISVGELAYFIASSPVSIGFPKSTEELFLEALKSNDPCTRHYAIRSVSNILTTTRYDEIMNLAKLEKAVNEFENDDEQPNMFDTYVICLVLIYTKKGVDEKYKSNIENLIRQLLTTNSSTARTMGIILSAATNTLSNFQSELESVNNNSIGELKSKALLTMCLIYENDIKGFSKIAKLFYSGVDKDENEENVAAIAKWSASFSNKILDEFERTKDYEIFTIISQAIAIKKCRNIVWSKQFESKFRSILKDVNYDDPNSSYILNIIETALYHHICDVMIVTDLSKAFVSKRSETRYLSMKLVADAVSIPAPPLIEYIKEHFLPQLTQLLEGDSMIAELTYRIFSTAAGADGSIIPQIAQKERLPLIFSRIVDNASALLLAFYIVQRGDILLADLVQAGLNDAIILSMNKVGTEVNVNLLYLILFPVAKTVSQDRNTSMIKMIAPLAQLASKCAELILTTPKAATCLSLLLHIFTPGSTDPNEEVLYKDCFNALGDTIDQIYQKNVQCPSQFESVVQMVDWASKSYDCVKKAMKQSQGFKKAIENAVDKCNDAKLKMYYSEILKTLLD